MARLEPSDVAGWLLKSTRAPAEIEPGWAPGEERELTRCVRRSYRLELVSPGQPVLLWVSGRVRARCARRRHRRRTGPGGRR